MSAAPFNLLVSDTQRDFRTFTRIEVYSQGGPLTHLVIYPDHSVKDRAELVKVFAEQAGIKIISDYENVASRGGNNVTYEYRILQES